jgi:effector-binding domain-containing protein
MRKIIRLSVCGLCLLLLAQTRPAAENNGFSDTSIGEPRIQDLKGMNYLHFERKTTIRQMNQTLNADIQKMMAEMKAHSISPAGPLMMVMQGMTANQDQQFLLEVGFDVAKGAVAPQGYSISELPADHCASVIFSGPMTNIGLAYRKLYNTIFGAGMMPTPESREYVLYWEGNGSPNNVVMITVGVP